MISFAVIRMKLFVSGNAGDIFTLIGASTHGKVGTGYYHELLWQNKDSQTITNAQTEKTEDRWKEMQRKFKQTKGNEKK